MVKYKFCSLDIETTGFNPNEDEILEIGFVFFEVENGKIILSKEYSKLFKPKKEVPENILALTGIDKLELDKAESFEEYKEEIQTLLIDAVLVGHNIGFDKKFLQGLGVKIPNDTVDTLDLAQIFLPTYASYNLENLVNFFGKPNLEAHRALSDAKACLFVLENLLKVFINFPKTLKDDFYKYISKSSYIFFNLLDFSDQPLVEKKQTKKKSNTLSKIPKIEIKPDTFLNFPLGENIADSAVSFFDKSKQPSMLVVNNESDVLQIIKRGNIKGYFSDSEVFNYESFDAFSSKPDLSNEEIKFILKILVWKYLNWQNYCISDINFSVFGGQYRSIIENGKNDFSTNKNSFSVASYNSFKKHADENLLQDTHVVFLSVIDLEKALSENYSNKFSWSKLVEFFENYFSEEITEEQKKIIEECIVSTDLFFGLLNTIVKTSSDEYVRLNLEDLPEEKKLQCSEICANFLLRLQRANELLKSDILEKNIFELEKFFEIKENYVKWIEMSPKSLILHSQPINIFDQFKKIQSSVKYLTLCDSLPNREAWGYFVKRFDINNFLYSEVKPSKEFDLFSLGKRKLNIEMIQKDLTQTELNKYCRDFNKPLVFVFKSFLGLKDFYYQNYKELKYTYQTQAQLSASGGNKILRNFSMQSDGILMVTDKIILKALLKKVGMMPIEKINPKSLIICGLPFEQYTHPYLSAVSKLFDDPFNNFSLPRALINFHRIIGFFYNQDLENLILADVKLLKPYSKVFVKYLENLKNN